MSAARLLASALAFSGCALAGAVSGARKKQRVEELHGLVSDVGVICRRLDLTHAPITDALLCDAGEFSFAELWRRIARDIERGSSPYEAFCGAESEIKDVPARRILSELFCDIGSADIGSELKKLGIAAERLGDREAEERKRADKGAKLTGRLSLMLGLAAALLLL